MAAVAKKQKSAAERAAQAMRSNRNKANRIRRNRKTTPKGSKNLTHRLSLAKKRVNKLTAIYRVSKKDQQAVIEKRINTLEDFIAANR